MFPTAGGPGSRTDLWLHGEAPRVAWTVVEATSDTVTSRVHLPHSKLILERELSVAQDGIRISTQVLNPTDRVARVTAGEHPCFDLTGLDVRTVDLGNGPKIVGRDDSVEHLPQASPGVAVLACAAIASDVVLEWDSERMPAAMVWRQGSQVIAVEPKSFVGRSADDVGNAWWDIRPGSVAQWWVTLKVARWR